MEKAIAWIDQNDVGWDGNIPYFRPGIEDYIERGSRPGVESLDTLIDEYLSEPPRRGYLRCWQLPLEDLRAVGRKSKRQFRALLCLSVMWHQIESSMVGNKQLRRKGYMFATIKDGSANPRAVKWLPVLTHKELAALCYPPARVLDNKKMEKARKALHQLDVKSRIHILSREPNKWQVGRPFREPWARFRENETENEQAKTGDNIVKIGDYLGKTGDILGKTGDIALSDPL